MTIDLITANPDENDPATIAAEIDLFVQQLKLSIPQINAVITAFNFNATNATSTDSLAISAGTKNLNVGAGKSYVKGMAVACAYSTDPTKWMRGEVLSYDSGTGALSFDCRYISVATGTYATWVISQAAIEASVSDSVVLVETGNGHGSTNNKIRLLTTTTINTGAAFTVAHNATLGTSVTINEPGVYAFHARDFRGGANGAFALTKNAAGAELTTSYAAMARTRYVGGMDVIENTAGQQMHLVATDRINAGDIIRMHTNGSSDGTSSGVSLFIRKIGNV